MAEKRTNKDPAFLFYPNDFIMGTIFMTDEQVGQYIRALSVSHAKGGKLSEKEIKHIVKEEIVLEKFLIDDEGFYYNERLLNEIEARRNKARVNRENGKKGGNPNFKKGVSNPYYKDNPTVMSSVIKEDNQKDNQKINITLKDEDITKNINIIKDLNDIKDVDINDNFNIFWKAYPKKKSKGAAEKAFNKLKPSDELLETILSAIELQKGTKSWKDENGKYIPYPATWLNAKGWEDEIETNVLPKMEDRW